MRGTCRSSYLLIGALPRLTSTYSWQWVLCWDGHIHLHEALCHGVRTPMGTKPHDANVVYRRISGKWQVACTAQGRHSQHRLATVPQRLPHLQQKSRCPAAEVHASDSVIDSGHTPRNQCVTSKQNPIASATERAIAKRALSNVTRGVAIFVGECDLDRLICPPCACQATLCCTRLPGASSVATLHLPWPQVFDAVSIGDWTSTVALRLCTY